MLRLQREDGLTAVERSAVVIVSTGLIVSAGQTADLDDNRHGVLVIIVASAGSRRRIGFEPFLARQVPATPVTIGAAAVPNFRLALDTLQQPCPAFAAIGRKNPTVPRLSGAGRRGRFERWSPCVAWHLAVYGGWTGQFNES